MSLFRRHATITTPEQLLGDRLSARTGRAAVTQDTALRNSAVWAALRTRADLVSTMPLDVYRTIDRVRVNVAAPPVLVSPGHSGGLPIGLQEWLYSTQVDLDRAGNAFGVVVERNGLGLPARIDLVALSEVTVRLRDGVVSYRFGAEEVPTTDVWHERQYTIAGLPLGLSPVAYAAWTLGEYASAQQFALDWFGGSAIPAAHLRNTAKTVSTGESSSIKERYKATVAAGDLFVTGNDWEFNPIQAASAQAEYIESRKFAITDIARFFGVPADLIDAAVSGQAVTYANITQRNLQFLIMQLGPTVTRRENALRQLVPTPRYVKLNRSSLLAMDPATRATTLATQITSRQIAPSEARAIEDRAPFTPEQLAEFDALFPTRTTPTGATS